MDRHARFEQVMRDVVEPVRRYLARRTDAATADDVLSETLLALWRRIEDVPDDPVPWAIGVARLQLANAQRAQRRQTRVIAKAAALDPPRDAPDHAEGDTAADTRYILDAIARLKPADAELVRLWAWEELDLEQIAGVLGISVNAATIRLHRARKKLKDHLSAGHSEVKEGDIR